MMNGVINDDEDGVGNVVWNGVANGVESDVANGAISINVFQNGVVNGFVTTSDLNGFVNGSFGNRVMRCKENEAAV